MRNLSSGYLHDRKAIDAVNRVQQGYTPVVVKGVTYAAKGFLQGRSLRKGQIVLGSYNSTNQGADLYEVLGVTGDSGKYGEDGVKFNSVKEALLFYGVKSLKALEELQNKKEYGRECYLVVKDLDDGSEGAWFYVHEGRWCRGSGAEPLTFTEMVAK